MDLTPANFSLAPAASTPGTVDGLQPATPGALPILVPWGTIFGNIANQTDLANALAAKADDADLNSHVNNLSNPHQVTKAQVGLGNVDNTSDMNKPVSTAQAAAIAGVSIPSGQISDASTLGKLLLTNATAAQDRTALGASASGDTVFTGTAAQGRTALGSSASGDTVFTGTAAAGRTALGSGTTGDALFLTATASAARAILGLDGAIAYRNLFINGGMECNILQQPAATTTGTYFVDGVRTDNTATARLTTQQEATTSFPGYPFCLLSTVTTSGAPAAGDFHTHGIPFEGTFMRKLGWGAASPTSIVVQFQIRSSITGTFALSVRNASVARSYVTTFTVNAANTTETKTVVIPGDTTGTWPTGAVSWGNVSIGMAVGSTFQTSTLGSWQAGNFVGATGQTQLTSTNGATFRITAFDVTPGSIVLPPEVLPLDVILPRAQRYFESSYPYGVAPATAITTGQIRMQAIDVNTLVGTVRMYRTPKLATPSGVAVYNPSTGTTNSVRSTSGGGAVTLSTSTVDLETFNQLGSAGGFTAGGYYEFHYIINSRI